jgi:hypothetical protein
VKYERINSRQHYTSDEARRYDGELPKVSLAFRLTANSRGTLEAFVIATAQYLREGISVYSEYFPNAVVFRQIICCPLNVNG